MYLFFSFSFRYIISCILVLWPFSDSKHCIYLWYIYIYIYIWCCYHFHLSLHVLFIFSLYTHISYYVCNHIFLFHTKMLWWVLFKVSQKDRLSKSFMPWTLFLQSFSRICVMIDFIVFNKWLWVEWFMTSLLFHLFVVI